MADPTKDPGAALWFRVSIDGKPIALFTECTPPNIKVTYTDRLEGGNPSQVHSHISKIECTDAQLTRAIDKDSPRILKQLVQPLINGELDKRTAVIEGLAANRKDVIVKYTLLEAVVSAWTAPKFSAKSSQPATETITISCERVLI